MVVGEGEWSMRKRSKTKRVGYQAKSHRRMDGDKWVTSQAGVRELGYSYFHMCQSLTKGKT
jgi:hypothetical protein